MIGKILTVNGLLDIFTALPIMRVLQIVLIYLVFSVNSNACGEITEDKFKKQNCRYGGLPVDGAIVEVKTRSKLKCAAECSKQTCQSYRYDKTTGSCYLSSFLIYDESGSWYCLSVLQNPAPLICSGYFQYHWGVCMVSYPKNKESTYEDMRQHCNQINGKLYQIEDASLLTHDVKRNVLASFVVNYLKNGHFVIQGKLEYCFPLIRCWKNEDGSVAVSLSIFPPADNVLAVNARNGYVDSDGIALKTARGYVCEEVHKNEA